jgi:hypothetical protein
MVTGHGCHEPVTLVMAKQELVLGLAIANHQNKMARRRYDLKNLGFNPVLTANIKKLAITVPANIDSDFLPQPGVGSLYFQARAHTGEMPTQYLCRHNSP